jgi:hypothetical protein
MLKSIVNNSLKQFRLQKKISKARAMNSNITLAKPRMPLGE